MAIDSLPDFISVIEKAGELVRVREPVRTHLEIAEIAELSPFHFARSFKQATGSTPIHFLTQRRIDLAKRLLVESELPIVEVGLRAGFKNQSHFTTLFRKTTAMTPKAYRNEHLR